MLSGNDRLAHGERPVSRTSQTSSVSPRAIFSSIASARISKFGLPSAVHTHDFFVLFAFLQPSVDDKARKEARDSVESIICS